jgi:hypothetical protein
MTERDEGDLAQEWDEVAAEVSTGPTKRVLEQVARSRSSADERAGYFRDYIDTDTASTQLWGMHPQSRAESMATSGKRPWLAQLMARAGGVAILIRPQGSVPTRDVRAALVRVAEVAVSWIEALDAREQEKRVARMQPKPWWRRVFGPS